MKQQVTEPGEKHLQTKCLTEDKYLEYFLKNKMKNNKNVSKLNSKYQTIKLENWQRNK